jgi:hypothetical protein
MQISQVIQRSFPVRFGFVPMVHTEEGWLILFIILFNLLT